MYSQNNTNFNYIKFLLEVFLNLLIYYLSHDCKSSHTNTLFLNLNKKQKILVTKSIRLSIFNERILKSMQFIVKLKLILNPSKSGLVNPNKLSN